MLDTWWIDGSYMLFSGYVVNDDNNTWCVPQIHIWTPHLNTTIWAFDRAPSGPSGPSCFAGGTRRGEGHLRSKTAILGKMNHDESMNPDESWNVLDLLNISCGLSWDPRSSKIIQDHPRSKVCWWNPLKQHLVGNSGVEQAAPKSRRHSTPTNFVGNGGQWIAEVLKIVKICYDVGKTW